MLCLLHNYHVTYIPYGIRKNMVFLIYNMHTIMLTFTDLHGPNFIYELKELATPIKQIL